MSNYLKSIYIRAKMDGKWQSLNLDELMETEDGQIQVKAWLLDKIMKPLDSEFLETILQGFEEAGVLKLAKLKEPVDPMMDLLGVRPIQQVTDEEAKTLLDKGKNEKV